MNFYLDLLRLKRVKMGLNSSEKRKFVNAYDDSIRYADKFLNRLEKDLKDDDPVFIVHADHGQEFWDHGGYGHTETLKLYEELIHIPLVIYNLDRTDKVEKPTSLIDLRNMILDVANNNHPLNLDDKDDFVISKVFENGKRKISVRSKEWKYIKGQKEVAELYNLSEDPQETVNLIDKKSSKRWIQSPRIILGERGKRIG